MTDLIAPCYFEMEDYTNVLLSRPLRKEIFRPYVTTKLTDQYVNNKAFVCVLLISIYMQIQKQSSLKSWYRDFLRESLCEVDNCCLRHVAGLRWYSAHVVILGELNIRGYGHLQFMCC